MWQCGCSCAALWIWSELPHQGTTLHVATLFSQNQETLILSGIYTCCEVTIILHKCSTNIQEPVLFLIIGGGRAPPPPPNQPEVRTMPPPPLPEPLNEIKGSFYYNSVHARLCPPCMEYVFYRASLAILHLLGSWSRPTFCAFHFNTIILWHMHVRGRVHDFEMYSGIQQIHITEYAVLFCLLSN